MVAALGGHSGQAAVGPSLVIKGDPSADTGAGLRAGFIGVQIYVLILEGVPKALDKHVVQPAATPIHGDADVVLPQDARESEAGKLTPLVGVEDIRRTVFRQGLFQG